MIIILISHCTPEMWSLCITHVGDGCQTVTLRYTVVGAWFLARHNIIVVTQWIRATQISYIVIIHINCLHGFESTCVLSDPRTKLLSDAVRLKPTVSPEGLDQEFCMLPEKQSINLCYTFQSYILKQCSFVFSLYIIRWVLIINERRKM